MAQTQQAWQQIGQPASSDLSNADYQRVNMTTAGVIQLLLSMPVTTTEVW